jgi:molybdenum cofactor guanylyltransferase
MRDFNSAAVTAAILAGGEGRRLGGRDKGLEPLCEKSLIEHVIATLQRQAGKILLCINRNADRYAAFAPVCSDRTTGFHGPLAGIATALVACDTAWLLTVPVDCPQPPSDLARRLHAADASIAVAHDGQRRQPLFALYRRELAAAAEVALTQNPPVWRWQDEMHAIEVDFSDAPQAFINLNTQEDFRDWEQGHRD